MDNGDEPIAISPNVEDHVPIHVVGILKHLSHFREAVPPNSFHNDRPGFNLIRRILVLLPGFVQVPAGNNMHSLTILHDL